MTRVSRFLVAGLPASGRVVLPAPVLHHAIRVLRLGPGDPVRLFDGRGLEVEALLDGGEAEITGPVVPLDAGLEPLVAACSPPRGERLEWLAEKVTELGAAELVLVVTERTPPRSRRIRGQRLTRAMEQACAQCGRARLPRLTGPLPLEEWLPTPDLPLRRHLLDPEAPPATGGEPGGAVILAGPEGGLTPAEQEAARERGFTPLGLGPLILRTETALVAALAREG